MTRCIICVVYLSLCQPITKQEMTVPRSPLSLFNKPNRGRIFTNHSFFFLGGGGGLIRERRELI